MHYSSILKLNGKATDPPDHASHSSSGPHNPDSLIHKRQQWSQQSHEVRPREYWPRDHTDIQDYISPTDRSPNQPHDFHSEVVPRTDRCDSKLESAGSADLPGRNRVDLDMRKHRPSFLEPVDKYTGFSADNTAFSDKVGGG